MESHYEVLGVAEDATQEEIKAAYKRKAQAAHPDREQGCAETMARLTEAYRILRDPEKRRRYDQGAEEGQRSDPEAALMEAFVEVMDQALEDPTGCRVPDLVAATQRTLTHYISQQNQMINDCQRRLETLEQELAGRVEAEEGGNLFVLAMEQKAVHLAHERDRITKVRDTLLEARKLLRQYRDAGGRGLMERWNAGFRGDNRI